MSTTGGSMNDVLRIRDIIFGEQMEAYHERFNALEARAQDLQEQILAMEQRFNERQNQSANDTGRQIEDLRALLTARLDALAYEKTARADLGAMLVELGERLRAD